MSYLTMVLICMLCEQSSGLSAGKGHRISWLSFSIVHNVAPLKPYERITRYSAASRLLDILDLIFVVLNNVC